MKENWEAAFAAVLESEGGYVNHPLDPGGITNLGVTKRAWEAYVGREVDEATMRGLTPEMVKPFYKKRYWDRVRGDDLPAGVDYAAFDFAVNSGPSQASRYLQMIVGVPVDGIIGPQSLEAIRAAPPDEIINALCDMRLDFLKRLPTWKTFGRGWRRRVSEVEEKATSMVKVA